MVGRAQRALALVPARTELRSFSLFDMGERCHSFGHSVPRRMSGRPNIGGGGSEGSGGGGGSEGSGHA